MFDQSSIIVGLEIGTSKVCAVVGELNSTSGALNIIGIGQARSRGVRKGEIVDPALAEDDIRTALHEAERMANIEIRSVVLGVTGSHLQGLNNRGMQPIVSDNREITEEDVQDALKNAKVVALSAQNAILHVIRQHFLVDGQAGIVNPVGMLGAKLEVDVHVVYGNQNRIQNAIRTVKGLSIEVEDVVFNGLASALALLTNDVKELGALVIDLGAGTTDYAVCSEGVVKHTGVLAVGGDHVTNDIACGLKVPLSQAERLKVQHGSALQEAEGKGQTVTITDGLGKPVNTVSLERLRLIMSLRVEEIFQIIADEIYRAGLAHYLRAGVFLCGGGARIPNVTNVAEQIFQVPVTIGHAYAISGLKSALDQPEFTTGIGLVKFGSLKYKNRQPTPGFGKGLKHTLNQLLRKL